MSNIKDVARLAGVSPATVSRVLGKRGNVKKETETAVLDSVAQLCYTPNILAQQMRQQRTQVISIIVPDIANPFLYEIFRGIEEVARQNDYEVNIVDLNNDSGTEQRVISALTQKKVDGIISLSATTAIRKIEQMAKGFPIVIACQYFEASNIPSVGVDNQRASKDIVNHLISLGHKEIAYLSTSPEISLYRDRLTGYMHALEENNITIDMNRVVYAKRSSLEHGYEAAAEILADPSVTAICAAGDSLAIGAIKAIREAGLRVPEDISVVGFDDIDYASFCDPMLTTVHQPSRDIGRQAANMLFDIIYGKQPETKKILEHKIIIRDSAAKVHKRSR